MARDPYIVRRDSLAAAFPPGHEPPALLLDFADWLEGRPWGSLGYFRLEGTLSDEAPVVDGGTLRREFSLFLYLPDGSLVGFWHPDGMPTAASPIVGLVPRARPRFSRAHSKASWPSSPATRSRIQVGATSRLTRTTKRTRKTTVMEANWCRSRTKTPVTRSRNGSGRGSGRNA